MVSAGFAIILAITTLFEYGTALDGVIKVQLYYREFKGKEIIGYEKADPFEVQVVIRWSCIQFQVANDLAKLKKEYENSGKKRIIFIAFDASTNKFVAGKFKHFDATGNTNLNSAAVQFFFMSSFWDYVEIVPTWEIKHKPDTSIGHKIKVALTPKPRYSTK